MMTAAAMMVQCEDLHHKEIVSSLCFAAFFVNAAATQSSESFSMNLKP
jgi:hypothetical protein